jgi:hypothetical protein
MPDLWGPPEGEPALLSPPVFIEMPETTRRRRRRIAPIIPTTITLAVLTAVGGVAAVNKAGARVSGTADRVGITVVSKPATAAPVATVEPTARSAVASGGATTATIAAPAASTPVSETVAAPAQPAPTPAPTATTTVVAPVLAKPLPAGGLYDGVRPPQFVLVSFDGAADQTILDRWTAVSKKAPAHMSFFLSMVYMLGKDKRDLYQGPRHNPGESNIGFAPTGKQPLPEWMSITVKGLQDAQRQGHELAMHFGGHWCGASGVRSWNGDDWRADLTASEALGANVDTNNELSPGVGSPFLTKPVGARTPCLEGNQNELEPVLFEKGYRYNASKTRNLNEWPSSGNGVWQYGFPSIAIAGNKLALLAVDYSINYNLVANHGDASVKRAAEIEPLVYDGYMNAFDNVYHGNRAPLELSNHFTHMSHDAYNNAVEKFVLNVCAKPEVHCVSYHEATDWLDAHHDGIAGYQKGDFVHLPRSAAG